MGMAASCNRPSDPEEAALCSSCVALAVGATCRKGAALWLGPLARILEAERGVDGGRILSSVTPDRNVLLLHDGELADIRALLGEVGTPFRETLCGEAPRSWDLAISTPRYLNQLPSGRGRKRKLRRVAVIEQDSNTLRALVRRCGADLLVRRPVHPTALRLLIKHAIYRGRRGARPRIAVGAPVDLRVGLRSTQAILADLSLEGCRLLTKEPIPLRQRLMIAAPRDSGGGYICGQIVREIQEPDHAGNSVGVRFQWLIPGSRKRLANVFDFYAGGPARLGDPLPRFRDAVIPGTSAGDEILLTDVIEPM
jgi:hypothetical protein